MVLKEVKSFFDLRVPVFYNKKNGQMMTPLPKKKMRKYIAKNGVPTKLKIRITKW